MHALCDAYLLLHMLTTNKHNARREFKLTNAIDCLLTPGDLCQNEQ